jgi:hypothetical protein
MTSASDLNTKVSACIGRLEDSQSLANWLDPPLVCVFTNFKVFNDDSRSKRKFGSEIFQFGTITIPSVHVDGRPCSICDDPQGFIDVFGTDVADFVLVDDLNSHEAASDADRKIGYRRDELF